MSKTNLEIIRQACIKANPSILDLKFGCILINKFCQSYPEYIYLSTMGKFYKCYRPQFKQFVTIEKTCFDIKKGREIRLSDVLLALRDKYDDDYIAVSLDGFFMTLSNDGDDTFEYGISENFWDLTHDNLESQSEECLKFLSELLIENKEIKV